MNCNLIFIIIFFTFDAAGPQPGLPMPHTNLIDTPELVFLLKQKKKDGFAILYDQFTGPLFGFIFRIVADQAASEDVLQEVFVKVWNNISQFDEGKGAFYTWLFSIARYTAIDYVRAVRRKMQLKNQMSLTNEYIDDTQLYQHAENLGLKKSVAKLEQKYREVIDLLYFYGYTQDEVATLLNLPLGTVKTRARAALQILRNQIMK